MGERYYKAGNGRTFNLTLRRVRETILAVEKYVISITYSECALLALSIQHAMRTRRIICHLWRAPLYTFFPHYLINGTTFKKKKKSY